MLAGEKRLRHPPSSEPCGEYSKTDYHHEAGVAPGSAVSKVSAGMSSGIALLFVGMAVFAVIGRAAWKADRAAKTPGTLASVLVTAYMGFLLWLFGHYMLGISSLASPYGAFTAVVSVSSGFAHSCYEQDQDHTGNLVFGFTVGFVLGVLFMVLVVAAKLR